MTQIMSDASPEDSKNLQTEDELVRLYRLNKMFELEYANRSQEGCSGGVLSEEADISSYEIQKKRNKIKNKKDERKRAQDDHKARQRYAGKTFWLACVWLGFVVLILLLQGFHFWEFSLDNKVLIAFITTTTFSVVGIFVIVAKWMFPKP